MLGKVKHDRSGLLGYVMLGQDRYSYVMRGPVRTGSSKLGQVRSGWSV
jgi:hypothetical protein